MKLRGDEILVYAWWMKYAMALLHYHRFQEAEPVTEKCLAKCLEWDPEAVIPFKHAKYYNKTALVRIYQGRFEEATRCATRSVRLIEKTE